MENPAFKTALGLLIKSMIQDSDAKQQTNHQVILPIGPTPQVLLDLGMPDLQMVITGKVVDKVLFEHGIPKGTIERLYSLLEAPKAIFKGTLNNPGSAVVTFEIKNMDPIIIAVHPNKQMARRDGTAYNNIASMYAKGNRAGESIEDRWTREGLLLWKAKPTLAPTLVVAPTLKVVGQK
jgi:hypothetical protein